MIIPGFSQYDITEDGVITETHSGRVIKQRVNVTNGKTHKRASLVDDNGMSQTPNIIRLLALAYLKMPEKNAMAFAKDGNNLNTTLDNVVWRTRSEAMKNVWDAGLSYRRPRESYCCTEASKQLVYDTLLAYDKPVTMMELSCELQVPYNVVRYSIAALIRNNCVRKTKDGYEVKR